MIYLFTALIVQEEEQRRVRRESKEKSKVGLLGVIWEFIQMEYFLYFYRYKVGVGVFFIMVSSLLLAKPPIFTQIFDFRSIFYFYSFIKFGFLALLSCSAHRLDP